MYRWSNYLKLPLAGILALSATRPVFTADLYVIDGGSGKTRALADWNDNAHWLDQANTTLQCALPAAHADFAGKLCLTANSAEYYVSNRAANTNNYYHTGAGFRSFFVYTPTSTTGINALFATHRRQDAATENGIWIANSVSASTQRYQLSVSRANAARTIDVGPTAASGFTIDVPTYADIKYRESDSPEFFVTAKSATCLSGNSAQAPSANDASRALHLFANAGTVEDKASCRFRSFLTFPVLDAVGETVVRQGIQQDTGIAT